MSTARDTLPSFLSRRDSLTPGATDETPELVEAGAADPTPAAEDGIGGPVSKATRKARKRARRLRKRNKALKAKLDESPVVVQAMAAPARARKRHWGLGISFIAMVLGPVALTALYLWAFAADQYASTMGFTVRSEDSASATDILGGLTGALGGGSTTTDSEILYEFITSPELVVEIDNRLDLESLYSANVETDPLLSYHPEGTLEDLTAYWQRMVLVSYDTSSNLMEVRVLAFTPEDAQRIAQAIFDESSAMINALSDTARSDATRYAEEDLALAVERLTQARLAITTFRLENQIIDPETFILGQSNLLISLQAQLAEALIEFDLLSDTTREGDPRLSQAQRRIEVIEEQIEQERAKFGGGQGIDVAFATTVAEFERLTVDRQFAEQSYTAALGALDVARADAARQSLYLAAYIRPQVAQQSEYPRRPMLTGLVALFALLIWSIGALVFYSLRDRR